MTILLIILTVLLAFVAVFFTIRPYVPAVLPAYLAMWTLKLSGTVILPQSVLIGWGAVALIMTIIEYMQTSPVAKATNGTIYISIGALLGTAVALSSITLNTTIWVVAGALIGSLFGAMVYGRTRSAAALQFPSRQFWLYAMAKIYPCFVAYSILGLLALYTIITHYSVNTNITF